MEVSGETSKSKHVVIVGGGISGLAAAYKLLESNPNLKITVLEAGNRCGGVISSLRQGELILEEGPDSILTQKPWALNLIKRLGLEKHVIETEKENRRTYVAWDGKLHALPEGFIMLAPTNFVTFFASTLFSPLGKLRMALEKFLPPKSDHGDESLANFVRRRFGKEALERIAQPMIGGIYTADPEKLSLKATMPRFMDMEKQHGSVISGLMKSDRKASGARYSLFIALDKGLGLLVDTLVSKLPADSIRTNAAVAGITKDNAGFSIKLINDETIHSDAVIIATPAIQASQMLSSFDANLSKLLSQIEYAPSAVLNLVYNKSDVPNFNGFGFVVPAKEKSSIIACTFVSQKYAGRAPQDTVLIRAFMGGALAKEVYAQNDEQLVESAKKELKKYLHINAQPKQAKLTRYPSSMPQYHLGHLELIADIQKLSGAYTGFALAGNYLHGPGIPDCVLTGETAAESVLEMLTLKGELQSSIG
ncbi:MAG: protoporphyrinogen oxidase [Candidatus Obscuribacterales bacterium]|nr:protoporphyrinogen oxidase [Candidatus Obscuribacterales bacterium]